MPFRACIVVAFVCGLFMLEGFVNRFWNAKQLSPLFRYTETVLSVSQSDFNFNGKTDSHINPIEKKGKNRVKSEGCWHLSSFVMCFVIWFFYYYFHFILYLVHFQSYQNLQSHVLYIVLPLIHTSTEIVCLCALWHAVNIHFVFGEMKTKKQIEGHTE